jgi:putative SOS response-associated peptidase YedK
VTNVRDDTVLTSPFWRPSFEARRCLVPASSYCEPDSNSPAGWHWFALSSGASDAHSASAPDERPLFAFPGIWKRYRGPMKKDGPDVEVDVYAFMTTSPNALTATIMHDRMPVLLSEPAEWETWLTGSPDAAYSLVRTYDAERMRIVQSGTEKRDLLGVTV